MVIEFSTASNSLVVSAAGLLHKAVIPAPLAHEMPPKALVLKNKVT